MRYSDISQVPKNYSISYERPVCEEYFPKMIIGKPEFTLHITYTRFQQTEMDESLFYHFTRFEDQYWDVTISHPLYEAPSKEVIDACIKEDNEKLEEYNKRHSNPCNCSKCIHYNGSWANNIKCSAIYWHELREKVKGKWNCTKYKEK